MVEYVWRGAFDSAEVEQLHAQCFDRERGVWDWAGQVERHSLGWVCARVDGLLIGWVNVVWDGAGHAFIVDTIVRETHRGRGIATDLVVAATSGARDAGCEWLHVDFEDYLVEFYVGACGFTPAQAGLIRL
jgi:ribosomal protein S18 acetylase RimI-like enzyme